MRFHLKEVLLAFRLNRKYDVVINASQELMDDHVSARVTDQPIEDVLIEITRQLRRKSATGDGGEMVSQFKKVGDVYYIE